MTPLLQVLGAGVIGALALIGAATVAVSIGSAVLTHRRERGTLPPALPTRPALTPVGDYVDEADDQPRSTA